MMVDDLFPPIGPEFPRGEEETVRLDPLLERRREERPWELRAAQWQAWTLAEMAFGPGVEVTLSGTGGYLSFRGMLAIRVPFREIRDHREREAIFLSWVGEDPVLSRLPLIFSFEPRLLEVG